MAAVYNVILQHTKRRDKRMRARYLCEVGELAGRAPVSHTLQLQATRLALRVVLYGSSEQCNLASYETT